MLVDPKTKRRILTPADEIAVRQGCRFDPAAASHVCDFFETFLHHSKGKWAGKRFELLPWQRDRLLEPLFGWKRADGTRRFRKGLVGLAKKNGKSTLAAGLNLYMLVGDGERGAEVYCAASDRQQAGIVFREAASMVRSSPALSKRLRVIDSTNRIVFQQTGSFLRTLTHESYTNEGLNIHALIFDELHAQKSRELWDALEYGGVAREQPLMLAITTAGWDRESICYEVWEYALKVRDGLVEDTAFFTLICTAAETDEQAAAVNVTDVEAIRRANPSLGSIIEADEVLASARVALTVPRKLNSFKRYRLNLWTEGQERWITDELWAACRDPEGPGPRDVAPLGPGSWRIDKLNELAGRECFGGLDLGASDDLTSFALCFKSAVPETGHAPDSPGPAGPAEGHAKDEEGKHKEAAVRARLAEYCVTLIPFFWLPSEAPAHRKPAVRAMYEDWCARGFITRTGGDTTDFARVRSDIGALGKRFSIRQLGIDRDRYGVLLCTYLQGDGFDMVPTGQGFRTMGTACWEWEDRILARRLTHGDNPVLTWMMRNTVVKEDEAGNLKPIKPRRNSHLKIDGVVAGLMALLRASETAESGSVYDYRGVRSVGGEPDS